MAAPVDAYGAGSGWGADTLTATGQAGTAAATTTTTAGGLTFGELLKGLQTGLGLVSTVQRLTAEPGQAGQPGTRPAVQTLPAWQQVNTAGQGYTAAGSQTTASAAQPALLALVAAGLVFALVG